MAQSEKFSATDLTSAIDMENLSNSFQYPVIQTKNVDSSHGDGSLGGIK